MCMSRVSVCLSVSISAGLHVRSSPKFCACYLTNVRFSSGGVVIRYSALLMTSCLHIMARNRRREKGVYLKVTRREAGWQDEFDTSASTETGPPRGSNEPGAESDIYDCLILEYSNKSCFVSFSLNVSAKNYKSCSASK